MDLLLGDIIAFCCQLVRNDSYLLKLLKDACGSPTMSAELWRDFFSTAFLHSFFASIIFFALLFFALLLFIHLIRLLCSSKARKSNSILRGLFRNSLGCTFFLGVAVYYIGYDYGGSHACVVSLLLRSVLSSFEMFLSKSNLIGVADKCKAEPVYMFCFSVSHTIAIVLSTSFAVACFWKRLKYYFRGTYWSLCPRNRIVHVFWGLNERSYLLAHDINKTKDHRDRILFVDFPDTSEFPSKGQSFSGLLGLFSYKLNIIRQISDLCHVLFRTTSRPSELSDDEKNLFDSMNIKRLECILKNSEYVSFYIFTENEKANLKAAINMLSRDVPNLTRLYCASRKTRLTKLIEEEHDGKLVFVDDSRMAVNGLKLGDIPYSAPIDYVAIDSEVGVVTSSFKALIVGFGTTGQDTLKFLYEFSAFPDKNGNKSPVEIHVVDNSIGKLTGDFEQEVPSLHQLEGNEIFLHSMNAFSSEFTQFLRKTIQDMNYVVIATGDDDRNITLATSVFEYAQQYRASHLDRFRIFVRIYNEKNRKMFETAFKVYNQFADCLIGFGAPSSIYRQRIVVDNHLEVLSKEFFKSYCKATGDEKTTWDNRKNKEIERLGLLLGRKSLRRKEGQDKANCMHCYTKERLIGLSDRRIDMPLPEWNIVCQAQRRDDKSQWLLCLYNASICEHLRWNASHLMMGYVCMTEDVRKHTSGTCDVVSKQHSCLVDWDCLDVVTQGYDYYVVKTTILSYLNRNSLPSDY